MYLIDYFLLGLEYAFIIVMSVLLGILLFVIFGFLSLATYTLLKELLPEFYHKLRRILMRY